jgi:hypothetical protein
MHAAARVGDTRVAIVHGDCEGLAGWGLSREALAQEQPRRNIVQWFAETNTGIIASSHSCLPVLMDFALTDGIGIVINNGAAGMPNFANTRYGLITRIALQSSPHAAIYGTRLNDVYIDALPVHYDHARWQTYFLANWPPGSAAHTSYYQRIVHGPSYRASEALCLTAGAAQSARRHAAMAGKN